MFKEWNLFNEFWAYILSRESIRIKKLNGHSWPWTNDKILQTYKFTNIQRFNDKTTNFLNKIYRKHEDSPSGEALYNCGLYRYFGTMEWAQAIGWLTKHDEAKICKTAARRLQLGQRVFTGAYVITNSGKTCPKYEVVAHYLNGLWQFRNDVVREISKTNTWEAGYRLLRSLEGFGGTGFMAKEVLQDYLLWLPTSQPADYMSFTPIGPGARRGLNRFFGRETDGRVSEPTMLVEIQNILSVTQPLWNKAFPGNVDLTAHDIQFCLCEFDKYERVRLGEGRPRSKYTPGR